MLERTAEGLKQAPELGKEHTLLLNGRLHFLEGDIDLDKEIKEKQPSLIYRVSWAEEALSRISLN